jgi:hypothetical protein
MKRTDHDAASAKVFSLIGSLVLTAPAPWGTLPSAEN